jgi:hypothetical protein
MKADGMMQGVKAQGVPESVLAGAAGAAFAPLAIRPMPSLRPVVSTGHGDE